MDRGIHEKISWDLSGVSDRKSAFTVGNKLREERCLLEVVPFAGCRKKKKRRKKMRFLVEVVDASTIPIITQSPPIVVPPIAIGFNNTYSCSTSFTHRTPSIPIEDDRLQKSQRTGD